MPELGFANGINPIAHKDNRIKIIKFHPVWDNHPLKFIGQIRMNDFYFEPAKLSLAYIFMTQPKDRTDPFFDPDIMIPDEGESAVIIQPGGKIPE